MSLDAGSYIISGVVTVASVTGYMIWQKGVARNRKSEAPLLRDVLVLLLVTGAFALSLTMLADAVGAGSLFFGGIVFFVALGWTVFAQPVVRFRMPGAMREIRAWELRGDRYRSLGVQGFGAMILRGSPLRHLNPSVYLSQFRGEPDRVCRNLEASEAHHFWGGLLTLPYLLYASWHGWWGIVLFSMALHLVANLYPIWHLRWVRGRLMRYVGRRSGRNLRRQVDFSPNV